MACSLFQIPHVPCVRFLFAMKCLRKRVFTFFLPCSKKRFPFLHDLGVYAYEVNQILPGEASEIEEGSGNVRRPGKQNKKRKTKKQRAITNDSPATVSAVESTEVPSLPSHDRKKQHSKRQLASASRS